MLPPHGHQRAHRHPAVASRGCVVDRLPRGFQARLELSIDLLELLLDQWLGINDWRHTPILSPSERQGSCGRAPACKPCGSALTGLSTWNGACHWWPADASVGPAVWPRCGPILGVLGPLTAESP